VKGDILNEIINAQILVKSQENSDYSRKVFNSPSDNIECIEKNDFEKYDETEGTIIKDEYEKVRPKLCKQEFD